MRLLRIQAEGDRAPEGIANLTARGRVDLLQLDYHRSHAIPVISAAPPDLYEFATGFPLALELLAKSLFLEPELHVVASAGWSNTYSCAEAAARALVDAGCPEIPLAAVRGTNLLPMIELLETLGTRLLNRETGAPWQERGNAPLLAADLQLGAGPVATALAEGARVVVTGHFDAATPAIAAALEGYHWEWSDHHKLAAAAVAARAAAWRPRVSVGSDPLALSAPCGVELTCGGAVTVELGRPLEPTDVRELTAWLRGSGEKDLHHTHADVQIHTPELKVHPTGLQQLSIDGIVGRRAEGAWRLDVLSLDGYVAETVVELTPEADERWRHALVAGLREACLDPDNPAEEIAVQELGLTGVEASVGWLHLACRTSGWQACHRFVELLAATAASHRTMLRLPAGRPAVHASCQQWPTQVSRDAVDIAVDTRPAREWI